jgi:hypothetical protein
VEDAIKCPHCDIKLYHVIQKDMGIEEFECINMCCPLYYMRNDGWRVRMVKAREY